jgi:hypothetical protein
MQTIQALLLQVLLVQVPPGNSSFSVAVDQCRADACDVATCAKDGATCTTPRFSGFYQAYVHQETRDEAVLRYQAIADAAVEAVRLERCKDPDNNAVEDCEPNPDMRTMRGYIGALAAIFGAAINESGLREDIETGRGKAKHPDDVGGQGRGPGGEVCVMQVHPSIAWKYVPDVPEDERCNSSQTEQSREAIAVTLLGKDSESLTRCFRTGLRMLAHAARICAGEEQRDAARAMHMGVKYEPFANQEWGMYSMYGTGRTCRSFNKGKTTKRASTARVVADALTRALQDARRRERVAG